LRTILNSGVGAIKNKRKNYWLRNIKLELSLCIGTTPQR
jgi:hypothetical protein